ncbi:ribonuclease H-like domain-containing protein [Tanacetum coccineum]
MVAATLPFAFGGIYLLLSLDVLNLCHFLHLRLQYADFAEEAYFWHTGIPLFFCRSLVQLVMRFLSLGWHLEKIHVTWAHLEKKRTRLRLYTIYLEELCIPSVETVSQASSDDVRIFKVIKARLVANERNQQYVVDCSDTFSPVVKPATIRIVLSLALTRNWPVHQLDVKNAFLNGDLSETVYMYQPHDFVDPHFPHHTYRLHRSLYGLKQALHALFQRFSGYALRVGFTSCRCDSSRFIYRHGTEVVYLLIYLSSNI